MYKFSKLFLVYDSDGSELAMLCGFENPAPITSINNTMTVVFTSDDDYTYGGFKAIYEQIGKVWL